MQADSQLTVIDKLLHQGALSEANALLEGMLRIDPGNRDALMRLAELALHCKQPTAALQYANLLLTQNTTDADALFFKAKAELANKNPAAALALINALESLLEVKTAPFYLLKGNVLFSQDSHADAAQAFAAGIAIDPGYAPAYMNLGQAMRRAGNLDAALAAWNQYVLLSPQSIDGWTQLAAVTSALGDTQQAQAYLERATALDANNLPLWLALGKLHAESRDFFKAKQCIETALRLDPHHDECASLLGWINNEQGDVHSAQAVLSPPTNRSVAFARRMRHALLLPQIYSSSEDLRHWRERYATGLADLVAHLEEYCPDPNQVFTLGQTNFLLAYQGYDDLVLQTHYANLQRRLIEKARPDLSERFKPIKRSGNRIKVGFVSSFLRECTVGHYFARWIEDLDAAQFDRTLIYTGTSADALTNRIAARCEHFVVARGTTLEIAKTIVERELDILIYPEIGMASLNYLLANMRLAPLQCAAWGHPVTSGSNLIDFFFTCFAMEPVGHAQHYAESLLYLPGIGTCYNLPQDVDESLTREVLSLPADKNLYLCPQSLFKIHPENDALYLDILAADENGILVFFQDSAPQVTQTFAARLMRGMTARGMAPRNQIKFIPRLNTAGFRKLLSLADVVLDTLHWSGGNTSLDCLAVGAPIVTLPGGLMRGRQSMAMLEILGVPELIVADAAHYVSMAVQIANDAHSRQELRARILSGRSELFDRFEPINTLAEHLVRLYEAH